jgi:hypothetical protein
VQYLAVTLRTTPCFHLFSPEINPRFHQGPVENEPDQGVWVLEPKRTVNNLLREVRLLARREELERSRQEEKFWQVLQAERDMLRREDLGLRVPVRRYLS